MLLCGVPRYGYLGIFELKNNRKIENILKHIYVQSMW